MTVVQLALFLSAAPGDSLRQRYQSAFQWDSTWYADIAERGYVTTIPPVPRGELSNVTHFPAYPVLIRTVKTVTGLDFKTAALVSANICTVFFWTYAVLFFQSWGFSVSAILISLFLIAAHPSAFFMATAFSEPIFLMTAFGLLYWMRRTDRRGFVFAALSGFVMTASRISGALAALYPVVAAVIYRRRITRAVMITAISCMGMTAFFAFCHFKFGMWNLYHIRQKMGWGNTPDYLAIFYPSAYRFYIPNWSDYYSFGPALNPYLGLALFGLVGFELKDRFVNLDRLGFVFCAAAIFYVTICGLYLTNFPAVCRYYFPIHALMMMAVCQRAHASQWVAKLHPTARVLGLVFLFIVGIASLRLQLHFASIFARGGPVL